MSKTESRIKELGFELPETAKPLAAYVPARRTGNLVFTSGQLPTVAGKLERTGKVGEGGIAIEDAAALARVSCLNALAAIKGVIGDLDKVASVVRVVVYVQSLDGFTKQPLVANGASEFLQQLFGDAGQHCRSAIGVNALPLDAPVEVELTVEVKG